MIFFFADLIPIVVKCRNIYCVVELGAGEEYLVVLRVHAGSEKKNMLWCGRRYGLIK